MTTKTKKSKTMKFLEDLTGGPLTFGRMLAAIREGEGETQKTFAARLGIPVQHLCNIERGLKAVSPERALKFARILKHSEKQFIRLVLQEELNRIGVDLKVYVEAA